MITIRQEAIEKYVRARQGQGNVVTIQNIGQAFDMTDDQVRDSLQAIRKYIKAKTPSNLDQAIDKLKQAMGL